jgi:hypothetical protein
MEVLDKKIKMALSKEIEEPYTYERAIKKALYKNKNYGIKHYIKKVIIIIASILSTLVGTFSVYAATGGKIGGMPAFDWIGLKFSEQYVEYKQPVENQILAFENTSVELVSTLCNEGLTILEFDVKLSEEDYKKLKIDESVITDEFLQQMEEMKKKTKDEIIGELQQDVIEEEIQKGNYQITPTDEQINKKYEERIKNIDKSIGERKNTLFTIALTLNNDQKGGTYNYDKFNPNTDWYANLYIDDTPYYVTSMQKLEKINKYEYKVYNFYLVSDDILKNKNDFKITLKNNKIVNMANWKVQMLSEKGLEEETKSTSDNWFGNVNIKIMEDESETMKIPPISTIDLPGEFEVNVSKNDILKDSKVIENPDIKSEFRNITQKVEKVVASPVQTVVQVKHSASQQSSNTFANRYSNPEIEHLPITNRYKVYDSDGRELSCLALSNKNTLIYSDGTREDYDKHDIPNKKYSNATWETVEYLLIENTTSEYIKIVPVETIRNPVDGQEYTGGEIYYEMDPLIINLNLEG